MKGDWDFSFFNRETNQRLNKGMKKKRLLARGRRRKERRRLRTKRKTAEFGIVSMGLIT